jgi:hypothetical protein
MDSNVRWEVAEILEHGSDMAASGTWCDGKVMVRNTISG